MKKCSKCKSCKEAARSFRVRRKCAPWTARLRMFTRTSQEDSFRTDPRNGHDERTKTSWSDRKESARMYGATKISARPAGCQKQYKEMCPPHSLDAHRVSAYLDLPAIFCRIMLHQTAGYVSFRHNVLPGWFIFFVFFVHPCGIHGNRRRRRTLSAVLLGAGSTDKANNSRDRKRRVELTAMMNLMSRVAGILESLMNEYSVVAILLHGSPVVVSSKLWLTQIIIERQQGKGKRYGVP